MRGGIRAIQRQCKRANVQLRPGKDISCQSGEFRRDLVHPPVVDTCYCSATFTGAACVQASARRVLGMTFSSPSTANRFKSDSAETAGIEYPCGKQTPAASGGNDVAFGELCGAKIDPDTHAYHHANVVRVLNQYRVSPSAWSRHFEPYRRSGPKPSPEAAAKRQAVVSRPAPGLIVPETEPT